MKSSATLWACVAAVFVLMAIAWTAMFFFAGKARVRSVPVENRAAETRTVDPARPEEAR